jgi:hypothetical protein
VVLAAAAIALVLAGVPPALRAEPALNGYGLASI